MADTLTTRVLRAYVARVAAGSTGRLLWLDESGQVVDLGPARHADIVTLAWAHRLAYRATRDRGERTRLAAVRGLVGRMGALKKVR